MKRTTMLAAMIAAATTPALAALAPEYQRAAELGAVIAVATEVLGPVNGVEFISRDVYQARSDECLVVVRIEDLPLEEGSEPLAGPRRFRAVAEPPACD